MHVYVGGDSVTDAVGDGRWPKEQVLCCLMICPILSNVRWFLFDITLHFGATGGGARGAADAAAGGHGQRRHPGAQVRGAVGQSHDGAQGDRRSRIVPHIVARSGVTPTSDRYKDRLL